MNTPDTQTPPTPAAGSDPYAILENSRPMVLAIAQDPCEPDHRRKQAMECVESIDRYLETKPNRPPAAISLACPKCGGSSVRRWGVGFEHLRRCPKCEISWDPDDLIGQEKPNTKPSGSAKP